MCGSQEVLHLPSGEEGEIIHSSALSFCKEKRTLKFFEAAAAAFRKFYHVPLEFSLLRSSQLNFKINLSRKLRIMTMKKL